MNNNANTQKKVFIAALGAGALGVLLFANASFAQTAPFDTGMVSLTFDDGHVYTYQTAFPIMEEAGFTSTQYVVTNRLHENSPGFMNAQQALDMHASGHEIGSHTRTHRDLTELSKEEQQSEIAGSYADLQNMGIHVTTFAYPFGSYSDEIAKIVQDAGYTGARTIESGVNTKETNPFLLSRRGVTPDTTLSQVQDWIDEAMQQKTWLILVFHGADSQGEFQNIVDYLKQEQVPVITTSQGIQRMAGQPEEPQSPEPRSRPERAPITPKPAPDPQPELRPQPDPQPKPDRPSDPASKPTRQRDPKTASTVKINSQTSLSLPVPLPSLPLGLSL